MIRMPLLLVLLALSGCSAMDTVKNWMGKDSSEKPAKLVEFNETAQFTERWHADFGDSGTNPLQPALTKDAVYGVSAKGILTRLDRATGKQIWRVESNMDVSAGVGAGEGLLLIGNNKGVVQAYGEDGKLRWKSTVSSEVMGVPQIADGLVLVRTGDGHIAGLDVAKGKTVWQYEHTIPALVVRSHASLIVRRGVAYAGFAGGKLVAIKLQDGSVMWENAVSQPRGNTELERISDITSNPVLNDAQLCAIAFHGRLGCFDASQGSPLWSRDISSDKGLCISRKHLNVSDEKGAVMALDKDNGATVWRNDQLSMRNISAPYVQDGMVVVGDYAGYLHALSGDDGHFVARLKLDGSAIEMAPVTMDGGLLVQTQGGNVYSLILH